jgi:MSHA pilin protein MshC
MNDHLIPSSKLIFAKGFTLIEMVAVIILVGIMAIVALPRVFSRQTYTARTFYDSTLSMLGYAQKIAIAQQRDVTVLVTATNLCLTYSSAVPCGDATQSVLNPVNNAPYVAKIPDGITVSSSSAAFSFSALGSTAAQVTLTINGDNTPRTVTVERETGYVH